MGGGDSDDERDQAGGQLTWNGEQVSALRPDRHGDRGCYLLRLGHPVNLLLQLAVRNLELVQAVAELTEPAAGFFPNRNRPPHRFVKLVLPVAESENFGACLGVDSGSPRRRRRRRVRGCPVTDVSLAAAAAFAYSSGHSIDVWPIMVHSWDSTDS